MTADNDLDRRCSEAKRILTKYPDRVPVIVDRNPKSKNVLPEIAKKKFLVPGTMVCGEFKYIIQKHLMQTGGEGNSDGLVGESSTKGKTNKPVLSPEQTIYIFVGTMSPKTGSLMSEVYQAHKAEDGFLYVTYAAENTLG